MGRISDPLKEERDESIGHRELPFPYRKGQYELAASFIGQF